MHVSRTKNNVDLWLRVKSNFCPHFSQPQAHTAFSRSQQKRHIRVPRSFSFFPQGFSPLKPLAYLLRSIGVCVCAKRFHSSLFLHFPHSAYKSSCRRKNCLNKIHTLRWLENLGLEIYERERSSLVIILKDLNPPAASQTALLLGALTISFAKGWVEYKSGNTC